MDRWPSGRRRLPAKEVYEQSYRGFESLPIRHQPQYHYEQGYLRYSEQIKKEASNDKSTYD